MNLVVNAAEAIGDGTGVVTVATGRGDAALSAAVRSVCCQREPDPPRRRMYDRRVYLEVRDDGPGIPAADLDLIFDPFFTTKPHGRGLGLASVLGIVRGHGGQLCVDSPPGGGTSIRVCLPPGPRERNRRRPSRPTSRRRVEGTDHSGRGR